MHEAINYFRILSFVKNKPIKLYDIAIYFTEEKYISAFFFYRFLHKLIRILKFNIFQSK